MVKKRSNFMTNLNHPPQLKYSKTDEWVRVEGDQAYIGITDYAQDQLGDIVYIELPWQGGNTITVGEKFGDVESVKATSELLAPLNGVVVRANEELKDHPEFINDDPYGKGWILLVKMSDMAQLGNLMDVDGYLAYLQGR
jgi:glycine cleavage system H protein